MPNKENLIPNNKRSPSEVRENGRKGGKASGEARRNKKLFRDCFEIILEKQVVGDKERKNLAKLGIAPEDMTNKMLLATAMISKVINGNVEAFKEVKKTVGEDNTLSQDHLDKLDEVLDKIEGVL